MRLGVLMITTVMEREMQKERNTTSLLSAQLEMIEQRLPNQGLDNAKCVCERACVKVSE